MSEQQKKPKKEEKLTPAIWDEMRWDHFNWDVVDVEKPKEEKPGIIGHCEIGKYEIGESFKQKRVKKETKK